MRSFRHACLAVFLAIGGWVVVQAGEEPPRLVQQRSHKHSNAVYWAAFSRDGKKLATASLDNSVKIWSVADGALLTTLKGHGDGVAFVAFLADGSIATASLDRTLRLWSAEGGAATKTMSGHQDYLACATLASGAPLLASGGFDKTVRLWDAQSATALATLTGHTATVQCVAISPDGRTVASGSDDRSIRLWDADSKKPLRTINGHTQTVETLAFSQKGDVLASGSADGSVRWWNLEGKPVGDPLTLTTTAKGGGTTNLRIKCLAFSPDGAWLAVGGNDGAVRLISVRDRREVFRSAAHKNTVYCVTFNPSGTLLASSGFDDTIHVWEVRGSNKR